ncbi:hypothetical protein [Vibrio crassostreae]|uniref:hypothetical protein n=1 Tax=Vibrio crassostreae TaxID=246167 RepID=UPI000F4AC990|nr:hypothetical protein [Vibrio crassostreae]ROQ79734.1 hypothetical protein EDB72_2426 [Vibrio crassostreae]
MDNLKPIKIVKEDESHRAPMLAFDRNQQILPVYLVLDLENGSFMASHLDQMDRRYFLSFFNLVAMKVPATLSGREINSVLNSYADNMTFVFNHYSRELDKSDMNNLRAHQLVENMTNGVFIADQKVVVDSYAALIEFAEDLGYTASAYESQNSLECAVEVILEGDCNTYVVLSEGDVEEAIREDWEHSFSSMVVLPEFVLNELLKSGYISESELEDYRSSIYNKTR